MDLKSSKEGQSNVALYDPPAASASFCEYVKPGRKYRNTNSHLRLSADLPKILLSLPQALPDLLRTCVPYIVDFALFTAFIFWNGGIVLGTSTSPFLTTSVHH